MRECWLCHGTRWKLQGQGGDQSVHSRGFFSTIAGWMILIAGFGLGLCFTRGLQETGSLPLFLWFRRG